MKFILGFIFGAAVSSFYHNSEYREAARRKFHFKTHQYETPEGKKIAFESEEYKLLFDILEKNPPKSKTETTQQIN